MFHASGFPSSDVLMTVVRWCDIMTKERIGVQDSGVDCCVRADKQVKLGSL